jgi:hypothetical protein
VRARKITAGLVVAGLASIALVGVGVTTASAAAPTQTTFVNEGFVNGDAGNGYILPATQSGAANEACLTAVPAAGATNTGSIPTCSTNRDGAGNGALRLTPALGNKAGGVGSKQSVPITKGIDAVFNTYQYNGNGADGIVFYLAATDPYNPQVPAKIGYLGGSLGYSASITDSQNSTIGSKASGLSNAYLGIGFDRFGNFSNRAFGGSGCAADSAASAYPNNVTVRGPGNGTTGYCIVSTTAGTPLAGGGKLSATGVTDRATAKVPVEIVVNPTASALPAQQATDVSVPAGQFAVVFTSIGGTRQVLRGALPNLSGAGNVGGIPSSWIDPATGYPYKLTYGWVAGTGGSNDIHEVNYLKTTTAAGPVPVLTARTGGAVRSAHAGTGTYTVTPTVSADGGSESQLVRTTTTFPAGVTPDVSAASGTGWTCTASGQVITCDQAAQERAAGDVLPTLTLPYSVSGTARTATISTVVASTDAEAITVTRAVEVAPQSTTVTVSDATATVGDRAVLTAHVASAERNAATAPTGTVRFTDAATDEVVCQAVIVSGVATCDAPTSVVGTTAITASYLGDADHDEATASAALVVTKVPTTITLHTSPEDVSYGEPVTLRVDGLEPQDGTVPAPTGTVEFREGDTVLCTATLDDTGCVTKALRAGTHTVTAVYSGDDLHAAATSVTVDLTVRKAATTIGTGTGGGTGGGTDGGNGGGSGGGGSDPDGGSDTTVTVTHGETTTLDTPNVPEDATGTIDYVTEDGTVLCTATLPDTTCALPSDLAGGTYRVHARYSGDDDHEPAEGEPFDLVVTAQPTELVAGTDTTHAVVGTKVRLRASGLPAGATGTVTFTTADGTVLCTVTLPETSCETDALPVGTNAVTVSYSGDASFAASSTTLEVVVEAAAEPTPVPSDDPTAETPILDPAGDAPSDDPTDPTPTASATAGAAAPGTGELAFTGSPVAIGTGVALAAALLLAGLVLLQVRRTRAAREAQAPTE